LKENGEKRRGLEKGGGVRIGENGRGKMR